MMDMDPVILRTPYHNEVLVDGDVKALAPLLALHDRMVAYLDNEYEPIASVASHNLANPHLVLYIRNSCPYCTTVTKYLKQERKSILIKDIGKDPRAAQELVQVGGKKQIPCLVINGKAMYESSDIVRWLRKHKSQY